jgi:hypothetical protein
MMHTRQLFVNFVDWLMPFESSACLQVFPGDKTVERALRGCQSEVLFRKIVSNLKFWRSKGYALLLAAQPTSENLS